MLRKFLTYFFIIFTAVLMTQPCEDFQAASVDLNIHKTVSVISDPIRSDNGSGSETCSPFCICGCCGLTVLHHGFTALVMTDRITVTETTPTPIYQTPTTQTYVDSIWQPPKV